MWFVIFITMNFLEELFLLESDHWIYSALPAALICAVNKKLHFISTECMDNNLKYTFQYSIFNKATTFLLYKKYGLLKFPCKLGGVESEFSTPTL